MKSKQISILLLVAAVFVATGCTDPDTRALLNSQHHPAVVAKPPAGDPAAQQMFTEYMKTHKNEPGLAPANSPAPSLSK